MLTPEQKSEAEQKLKNISEERTYEEETKAKISTRPPTQKSQSRLLTMLSQV